MPEIKRSVIVLDEEELMELERIMVDEDGKAALKFLKKSIYRKIDKSQQGRLKSHLDTQGNPVELFVGKK